MNEPLLLQSDEPSLKNNKIIKPPQIFASILADKFSKFPFNCICYTKIKICLDETIISSIYGTGIMIQQDLVMTVAHNVIDYISMRQQILNNKKNPIDQSQIKLALFDGKDQGIYDIKEVLVSKKYQQRTGGNQYEYYDYALVIVQSRQEKEQKREEFPIPLALESFEKNVLLEIYGYNLNFNLKNTDPKHINNSSIFMQNPFGGEGQLKAKNKFDKDKDNKFLYYDIETDKGTSGSPLLTKLLNRDVFIGLHKACQINSNSNNVNFGINILNALKQANQWGYQLYKKPLIFTKNTIQLHKDPSTITKSQIICYMDKGITSIDINVITSYDLTLIRSIILSGNRINDEGFKQLTKRKFPYLDKLFLPQNILQKLNEVQDGYWDNISTVKTFVLNINKISEFPHKIGRLMNLSVLYISHNNIKDASEGLVQFCKSRTNDVVVHIYQNKISLSNISIKNAINIIENTKVKCYWEKEDVNK